MSENRQLSYVEFREQYEVEHPASVPVMEVYIGEYAPWVTFAVGAMFVTAAFFSGVHTVPVAHDATDAMKVAEWLRQLAGISAFLFIEVGILLSAYFLVKRFSIIILIILIITSVVAMGANLYSVQQAFADTNVDNFTKIITILFGLVAPIMAGLSGGVFVELHQSDRVADARSNSKFRQQQVEWDKEVGTAWKKFQKDGGRVNLRPQLSASSAELLADGRTRELADTSGQNTGQGYTKRTDARDVVKAFLENNPDKLEGKVREIADQLKVGKTTVSDVQREMREHMNVNRNGYRKSIEN